MKPCLTACLVWVALASNASHAAVFERDWKTPGDGLLTFDDVNLREWLDLSVSRLDQFPEPRLENAIAEIAPGGLFEGFTWAKRGDVIALAESGGIDTSISNLTVNQAPTTHLIELLSPTLQSPGVLRAIGFIDETTSSHPSAHDTLGAAFLINFNPFTGDGFGGLFITSIDDLLHPASNGLMLYRTVPEPVPIVLVLIGLYGMACLARQNSF